MTRPEAEALVGRLVGATGGWGDDAEVELWVGAFLTLDAAASRRAIERLLLTWATGDHPQWLDFQHFYVAPGTPRPPAPDPRAKLRHIGLADHIKNLRAKAALGATEAITELAIWDRMSTRLTHPSFLDSVATVVESVGPNLPPSPGV